MMIKGSVENGRTWGRMFTINSIIHFFFIYAKHLHVLFHYPLRLNKNAKSIMFNQHSIKDDGQREPANGLHV